MGGPACHITRSTVYYGIYFTNFGICPDRFDHDRRDAAKEFKHRPAYSGSNETVFGAKGPAAFLAKVTMFFSILFVINTVALGYIYSSKSTASVIDSADIKVQTGTVPSAPVPPAVPAAK